MSIEEHNPELLNFCKRIRAKMANVALENVTVTVDPYTTDEHDTEWAEVTVRHESGHFEQSFFVLLDGTIYPFCSACSAIQAVEFVDGLVRVNGLLNQMSAEVAR